jgi:hyperosmotically inducible protein
MKNKFLNILTLTAISCSFSPLLADDSFPENTHKLVNESSSLENLVSDSVITTSIKRKFLADNIISSFDIKVVTINGKVTLTGIVPSNEAKERAIHVAKSTKGVLEVLPNLEINDSSLVVRISNDSIITSKIKLDLLDSQDLNTLEIHVKTVNGNVTLTGTVPDENAKRHAILIAKSTRHVKEVDSSKLKIDKSSYIKNIAIDTAITSLIKLRFLQDDELSGFDIHVKTINKEVTLSGVVPSEYASKKAVDIARLTNGVEKVNSKLKYDN